MRMNGLRKNARNATRKDVKIKNHVRANVKKLAIFVMMEELLPARYVDCKKMYQKNQSTYSLLKGNY